jgi:hypothetical protein
VALESGAFGDDWTFGTDGFAEGTSRLDEALDQIVASSARRERGGQDLAAFLARTERRGPASAVLFVPPRPGPWLGRIAPLVKARASRTRVVVALDGVRSGQRTPLWRRLLTVPDASTGTPSEELDAVLTGLAALRCDVLVVDRRTGKRLGKVRREAMRALEAAA